ncbi:SapC family protein [Pseudomonas borbori]
MTQMLLYKDVKRLNRDEHKSLRLHSLGNSEFAAGTHMVPLAGLEFFQAARHYPILFVGDEQPMPIALLGLEEGHNGFVDGNKQWLANTYMPAFVRRYPFVLAQDSAAEFTICFDAAYAGWNEREGKQLFGDDGSNSEYLNEMLGFLQQFTLEMVRTRLFVDTLKALGLLTSRSLELTHSNGERFTLSNFQMVDEEKFLQLDDAQVVDLHRAGYLGWIYAHLMALGNADQLFESFLARRATQSTRH